MSMCGSIQELEEVGGIDSNSVQACAAELIGKVQRECVVLSLLSRKERGSFLLMMYRRSRVKFAEARENRFACSENDVPCATWLILPPI